MSEKGNFGKGILALVAEDIFGKALITASDPCREMGDAWAADLAKTSGLYGFLQNEGKAKADGKLNPRPEEKHAQKQHWKQRTGQ